MKAPPKEWTEWMRFGQPLALVAVLGYAALGELPKNREATSEAAEALRRTVEEFAIKTDARLQSIERSHERLERASDRSAEALTRLLERKPQ